MICEVASEAHTGFGSTMVSCAAPTSGITISGLYTSKKIARLEYLFVLDFILRQGLSI